MKNLTIKKVALGLVLAGYAASGAFAATSATTAKTIIGNEPTIKSVAHGTATTPTAGKYTLIIERKTGSTWNEISATDRMKAGDRVTVKFSFEDTDGDDAEPTWLTTAKKKLDGTTPLKFEVSVDDAGTLTPIAGTASTDVILGTSGEYQFIIPSTAGKKKLAISLTPVSQFGQPYYGQTISGSLFADGNTVGPIIPPGCEDTPTKPECILPSDDDIVVRIVKGSGTGTNAMPVYGTSSNDTVAVPAGNIPKVGDQFTYYVVDTSSGSEVDVTTSYTTAKWSFGGTDNSLALGATTPVAANVVTSANYTIGVNSADAISALYPAGKPEAGAQGFLLNLEIAP